MDHHKNDISQSGEDNDDTRQRNSEEITEWDQNFLKIDDGILFELIKVRSLFIKPFSHRFFYHFSRLLII
jgi:hypothetical protein